MRELDLILVGPFRCEITYDSVFGNELVLPKIRFC